MHINRKWGSNIKLIYAEDMTTVVEESWYSNHYFENRK